MKNSSIRTIVCTIIMAIAFCTLQAGDKVKQINVTVNKPGTLAELLTQKQIDKMGALCLNGTINGKDLRFLRTLMGVADSLTDEANPIVRKQRLEKLDIKSVKMATGGGQYRRGNGIGLAWLFPSFAFEDCNVGEVVMPDSVPHLHDGVFHRSKVERVVLAERTVVAEQTFEDCPKLKEIVFPQFLTSLHKNAISHCPRLHVISMNAVGYISAGGSINNCDSLREITIGGILGHIDGWETFQHCPNLETIVFKGYVVSTGGDKWLLDCPRLKDVIFEKAVCHTAFGDTRSPVFRGYTLKGPVFKSAKKNFIADVDDDSVADSVLTEKYLPTFKDIAREAKVLDNAVSSESRFLPDDILRILYVYARDRDAVIAAYSKIVYNEDSPQAYMELSHMPLDRLADDAEFKAILEKARRDADFIQILRDAPAYEHETDTLPAFTYDFDNPKLKIVRDSLHLDSIAGNGDEISRIKNVMYWLHNTIRHNGSSSWPQCDYNAWELYKIAKRENRPYNCRFLGMILADCYLALGIPARFLTCASKWTKDGDCHVTVMVWSQQLGKWVWMDPSFAAYITDENGLLLHHGEVRERLINGKPLVLNEDANWNNENKQTKEDYLERYMAKNLYTLSCHLNSRTEAESGQRVYDSVALIPTGTKYKYGSQYVTNNDLYFWQAPQEYGTAKP